MTSLHSPARRLTPVIILRLPPELLRSVLLFLPFRDILSATLSCRALRSPSIHPTFWRDIVNCHICRPLSLSASQLHSEFVSVLPSRPDIVSRFVLSSSRDDIWKSLLFFIRQTGFGLAAPITHDQIPTLPEAKIPCIHSSRQTHGCSCQFIARPGFDDVFRVVYESMVRDDAFASSLAQGGVYTPSDFVSHLFALDFSPAIHSCYSALLTDSESLIDEDSMGCIFNLDSTHHGMPEESNEWWSRMSHPLPYFFQNYTDWVRPVVLIADLDSPECVPFLQNATEELLQEDSNWIFVCAVVGWQRQMKTQEQVDEFHLMTEESMDYCFPDEWVKEDEERIACPHQQHEQEKERDGDEESLDSVRAEVMEFSRLLKAPYVELSRNLAPEVYQRVIQVDLPRTIVWRAMHFRKLSLDQARKYERRWKAPYLRNGNSVKFLGGKNDSQSWCVVQ